MAAWAKDWYALLKVMTPFLRGTNVILHTARNRTELGGATKGLLHVVHTNQRVQQNTILMLVLIAIPG
jgi:hypothetical protein